MSLGISTRRFLRVSLTLTRSVFMVDEGVRKGGVEPPKPFGYRILSPARLPVPPLSHGWSRLARGQHDGNQVFLDRASTGRVAVSKPLDLKSSIRIVDSWPFRPPPQA